jgi:hypothetical protein
MEAKNSVLEPRRVTIAEARKLCRQLDLVIVWRPEVNLPEPDQYCLVR